MTGDDRIKHINEDRDQAIEIIRNIEEKNWRFFESHGNGPMLDVTAQHLLEKRRSIETLDHILDLWKACYA